MLKRTGTFAALATLVAACTGVDPTGPGRPPARDLAPSLASTAPGIPGEPNCHGQTTAFIAQGGVLPGLLEDAGRGIGGIPDMTAPEVHEVIRQFCTPGGPPT